MNITRGKINSAQKVVIYGVEGIGKSTFAAQFPQPLFIDTEGSTSHLDVARFDKPSSWTMLLEQIKYAIKTPGLCKTLVIDTADWAERICVRHVCDNAGKNGIEDFGYGNGFTYVNEEFGKLLNLLEEAKQHGINIVVTAHAQLVKFEQPDEAGAYDRYELKLGFRKTEKRTAMLIKEWADMVLFANYKTLSVATDDKGKKHKAQGGKRVMYTTHHPCWDAKNRCGLPDMCDFDYSVIAAHIPGSGADVNSSSLGVSEAKAAIDELQRTSVHKQKEIKQELDFAVIEDEESVDIPQALSDLMTANNVTEEEVRKAVAHKGYYPVDTPISAYDEGFVNNLVAVWEQMYAVILEIRNN